MNDTVTKILALADDYADVSVGYEECRVTQDDLDAARQALQDELTRLFTPLKGQTFNTPDEAVAYLHGYAAACDKYKIMGADNAVFDIAANMEEHGITGEKNAIHP